MIIQTFQRTVPVMQPDTPTISFPRHIEQIDLDRATSPEVSCSNTYSAYVSLLDQTEEDNEDVFLHAAIEASLQEGNHSLQTEVSERLTCKDIVGALMEEAVGKEPVSIIVHRRRLLSSAVRATKSDNFSFSAPLQVTFAGEDAEDGGGPSREFFQLLMKELVQSSGMFQTRVNKATFTYDISRIDRQEYKLGGQLVLWSLTHGGPGIAALCPSLFAAMVKKEVDVSDIDCLTDHTTRVNLERLLSCTSQEEFSAVIRDLSEWILDQGITNVCNVGLAQRDCFVKSLLTHNIYHRVHSAVMQFIEGLGPLWEKVQDNPTETRPLFVNDTKPLAVTAFRKLYSIISSPEGSNNRVQEDDTIYCWELFIHKCAENKTPFPLEDILHFWTGATREPPCGFDKELTIQFFPKVTGVRRLPSSSTCALIMWLPRGIEDPDQFSELMKFAVEETQGFGRV